MFPTDFSVKLVLLLISFRKITQNMSVFIPDLSNKQTLRGYKQPIQVLYKSLVWLTLGLDNPLSEKLAPVTVVKSSVRQFDLFSRLVTAVCSNTYQTQRHIFPGCHPRIHFACNGTVSVPILVKLSKTSERTKTYLM